MAMHSQDPAIPLDQKQSPLDLAKLGYARSFLKNCQEDRSQIDKCTGKSWFLANHKAGIYPICIKQIAHQYCQTQH